MGEQEWDTFAPQSESDSLNHTFNVDLDEIPRSVSFEQVDVKQQWTLAINSKTIGRLPRDENHMVVFFDIPEGVIKPGSNKLTLIQTGSKNPDDIYFGYLRFHNVSKQEYLTQRQISIQVNDVATNQGTPCRLTILNSRGCLASTGNESTDTTAVREGVIYSSTGQVTIQVAPGKYTIYAGRGMEWSIDSVRVDTTAASTTTEPLRHHLTIRREVDTTGMVACDTHVHTFTYSRHGDASLNERIITVAGEGIELPVATDHNLHINYAPLVNQLGLNQYYTPVIGNEVTTRVGHFNIFPVANGTPLPNHTLKTWKEIAASIRNKTGASAIILNHARDVHGGITPFSPLRHNHVTGRSQLGWQFPATAMELVNSGAIQTDVMRLYRDWFGLLNRGLSVTGVGCSDSHDVARHFIGQARTYIYCDDSDIGNINVKNAVQAFTTGKTNLSYGLLTTMLINKQFGPGEITSGKSRLMADIKVQGPSWVTARRLEIYANGELFKSITISGGKQPGIKWSGKVDLSRLRHDCFIVAIARGDGVAALHWPTAKPYQPTSKHFEPYTIGSTGVIYLDVDRDDHFACAKEYAQSLIDKHDTMSTLFRALKGYDTAVAAHVAELLDQGGKSLHDADIQNHLKKSAPVVRRGFSQYTRAELAATP
ncbi:MAG: CehA/McbA family metallohydrolase [Planctomycetaceae bacterium]|nr:CehA/McbA family metallohydrolase [Planctomycetaceae bacterium]